MNGPYDKLIQSNISSGSAAPSRCFPETIDGWRKEGNIRCYHRTITIEIESFIGPINVLQFDVPPCIGSKRQVIGCGSSVYSKRIVTHVKPHHSRSILIGRIFMKTHIPLERSIGDWVYVKRYFIGLGHWKLSNHTIICSRGTRYL